MINKIMKNLKSRVKSLPYPTVFDTNEYVLLSDVKKEIDKYLAEKRLEKFANLVGDNKSSFLEEFDEDCLPQPYWTENRA